MANRVDRKRKPKPGSGEDKLLGFRAAVGLERLCATPDQRAALDAAEAELDRAAEALAALVSPEAFRAKLEDLARGRTKRGRPPGRTGEQHFMRHLLEATGDVAGERFDTGEVNRAAAECLFALGKGSASVEAALRRAQEERRSLQAEYGRLGTDRDKEILLRAAWAGAALEGLPWEPHEKKAIEIFLARFGSNDVVIDESLGAPRRRAEEGQE